MLIAAKIVRVDPGGRLPVIAHLSVLQAIGWRWLCVCTTNRVDVPETAPGISCASVVGSRNPSAKVLTYVASIVSQTSKSPRRQVRYLLPEGHTKILSIRSDGASPNSTALIIRGPKSWSQGAGMISPYETTKGRQNSRAGRQALTNMAEVPNPTVREPWQKLRKCFMNWRTSRADQVLTAQALLTERPTRHPWFLRLLLLIGLSSTPAWISSAIRMG